MDYLVYTYFDNSIGLPQNPGGGIFFAGGTGPGDGATYARGQHDFTPTAALWEFSYDFACAFDSPDPAANNLGSFSGQSAPNPFIHIFTWVPGLEGVSFTAGYMFNDAAGTQFPAPGEIPGPQWDNLLLNNWYRSTMMIDFVTNQCIEVSIMDVTGGGGATSFTPTDWYLDGGQGGTSAMEAFRMFAGGGAPGNSVGFDNFMIREMTATAVEPTTWGAIKNQFK